MIIQADSRQIPLADKSVHCVVTSPPYYALRDYGVDGQIGLEKTLREYIENLVVVFREVRRVLRDDGTCWVNIGDTYAGTRRPVDYAIDKGKQRTDANRWGGGNTPAHGTIKPKDMMLVPQRLAIALQDDGWWVRSEIIWYKPNGMVESVRDRPTKSHETLWLLAKSERYFYDAEAIKEPSTYNTLDRYSENIGRTFLSAGGGKGFDPSMASGAIGIENRKHLPYPLVNKRDVWRIPTQPTKEAHFATYPEDLVKPCILAGTSAHGCCQVCGAPYAREFERGELVSIDGTSDNYKPMKFTDDTRIKGRSDGWTPNHIRMDKQTGWVPTCKCGSTEPLKRPIVLDPFFGSGTTGKVARMLGRDFVGLDLSTAYLREIAVHKTAVQPGMLIGA